ncbi:surface lipoprotein assembly modifier [Pseudodesulfovibrio sediminis]|uniref:Surface lipoprotein assembly modifier C-terminal domain-containing protein n=1 Tax=Pseudodesulfovibrio sediminis TaxID=2810563 RepID=A0ABN6EMN9_9BACT|nr:tetratricopeptide repeat protein [Pseudodesulfovibrio sediminis]BCS86849.1 hypothetical protein PSDVSF_00910 [Pseudodesulfovibrio sediminis]
MPTRFLFCFLFVCLLTVGQMAAPLVANAVSGDPYNEGMAAFQAGDYDKACPLLKQACSTRPNNIQLLLNLAVCQFYTKNYEGAVESYHILHAMRPDDQRVTFELGRSLAECGRFKESRKYLLEVEKSNPPKELRSGLDGMLDRLDDLERRTRFGATFEVSVLNDDNVNVGPNDGILGNIILDPDTYPKASTGVGYSAMIGVEQKLDMIGDWRLSVGLSRNEVRYSRYTDYNVGVTNVSLRLNHKLEQGSIQGALNYTDIEQGEMNSINTFAPSVMWMHTLAPDKQLITDASIEFRDNRKNHESDSHYYTAGSYLRWFFGGQNQHYLLGGGRVFTENARAPRNSNDGYEVKLAPSFGLPNLFRFDLSATFGKTVYNAPPAAGVDNDRRDQKHTFSGTLSRQLWDKNSKATLSFIHTRNKSNYVPNSYFKNTAKFALGYNF